MSASPPTDSFNPYHEWLGIPVGEPVDHYRLLGVPRFESNPKVIENAYDAKMAFLRTKQLGAQAPLSQRVQSELTVAQRVLLDPGQRAAYDAELRRTTPQPIAVPQPRPVRVVQPQPQVQPVATPSVRAVSPNPIVASRPSKPRPGKRSQPWMLVSFAGGALITVGLIVLLSTQGDDSLPTAESQTEQKPPPSPKVIEPPKKPVDTRSAARVALDEAVALHTRQMNDARLQMLTAFETVTESARKDESLSATDKLNLVTRLEVEKKAFDKAGYVPFSAVMRDRTPIYIKQVNDADKQLHDAFEQQINAAVTAANDKDAGQFKLERDQRLPRRVIARWSDWTMYSNGQIHHKQWGVNHWTLRDNRIDLAVGDRWTISKLGDHLDCVNKFNIRFGLGWQPPE